MRHPEDAKRPKDPRCRGRFATVRQEIPPRRTGVLRRFAPQDDKSHRLSHAKRAPSAINTPPVTRSSHAFTFGRVNTPPRRSTNQAYAVSQTKSHRDVNAREEQAALQHGLARRHELRQHRQIEDRDLGIQNVRQKSLKERRRPVPCARSDGGRLAHPPFESIARRAKRDTPHRPSSSR